MATIHVKFENGDVFNFPNAYNIQDDGKIFRFLVNKVVHIINLKNVLFLHYEDASL